MRYDYWFYPNKYLTILEIQARIWSGVEIDRDISSSLIKTIRYFLYSPFPVPPYSEEG
jgi:hypothetical protein